MQFYHYNWNYTAYEWRVVYNALTKNQPLMLAIYNPGLTRQLVIKVKVPNNKLDVLDWKNKNLVADLICANKTDKKDCDLYFSASLQGYALNYFKLVPNSSPAKTLYIESQKIPFFYLYKTFQITSSKSIKIHKYNNKFTYANCNSNPCQNQDFTLHFNYYVPHTGSGQNSGAYIFRPSSVETHSHSKKYSEVKSKEIFVGQLVTVVHLVGKYIDTQMRFYNNDNLFDDMIEVENHIGSIPVGSHGKEVVVVYEFKDIVNKDSTKKLTWYTDSNGLEMQERKYNYRPTWDLEPHEPAAGNYYPVNAIISIQDKQSGKKVSILPDRTEGGASLSAGQIELMVHRRLKKDDHRGVGEPLDETN